jgi:hypothetical protein
MQHRMHFINLQQTRKDLTDKTECKLQINLLKKRLSINYVIDTKRYRSINFISSTSI